MKIRVLATGVRYQCKNETQLRETQQHLEQDKPELHLVRITSHDYGVEVHVKDRRRLLAKIQRFDVLDVLELMRIKGFSTLRGRVVSVSSDGAWFTIEIEAPEGFVSTKATMSDKWANWTTPDIPLLADIPGHTDLEAVISYLDAALHCPNEFDTEITVEYLHDLIQLSRYDVTLETQMALKQFRRLVESSADYHIHAIIDQLVHAINDMGSSTRQTEMDELYYQSVVDSDAAADMINAWYSSVAYTMTNDITLEDMLRKKLRDIEHSLQTLPYDLYREVDRKGRLLHLLLYKGIPYDKYRALMSALIMRDHLIDELETVIEYSCADEPDDQIIVECSPLDTDEAWRLWRIAQEKGWVDANRQPIMNSQPKAAILASVIADCLSLSPRWKPFETLWNIDDLSTKFSKAHDFRYFIDILKMMKNALTL